MRTNPPERNLGEQPIALLLQQKGLAARQLVGISDEHLTYKMVSRACKGRWLTPNVRQKILNALNRLSDTPHTLADLFTYDKETSD